MRKGPGNVYEQSHLIPIRWEHTNNRAYDAGNPASRLGHAQQYSWIKSIHISPDFLFIIQRKTPFVPHKAYQNTVDKIIQNTKCPYSTYSWSPKKRTNIWSQVVGSVILKTCSTKCMYLRNTIAIWNNKTNAAYRQRDIFLNYIINLIILFESSEWMSYYCFKINEQCFICIMARTSHTIMMTAVY